MARRKAKKKTQKKKPLMTKGDLQKAINSIEAKTPKSAHIPLSVTIITKSDPKRLRKCIESVKRALIRPGDGIFGDEILVLDTGTPDEEVLQENRDVCADTGAVFYHEDLCVDVTPLVEKWLPDWMETYKKSGISKGMLLSFSAARQRASGLATHHIQFWIDTDDIIEESIPGKLRWTIDQIFSPEGLNGKQADSLFLEYKYAFDKSDGSCITTLRRERCVDTNTYHWVGRCHETLIPIDDKWDQIKGGAMFDDIGACIVHDKQEDDARPTDIRNYIILRNEIEDCRSSNRPIDPRTVFYMGNACRGLALDAEALDHYEALYLTSGSLEDRFLAMYYSAMIYLHDRCRRPLDAIDMLFTCLRLKPRDPRTHFSLARSYYTLGRYDEALQWFHAGRGIEMPKDILHAVDPQHIELLPYQIAALCYKEKQDVPGAQGCVEFMEKNYPNHELTKAARGAIDNWTAEHGLVDAVMRLVANEVGPDRKADPKEVKERALYHLERLGGVPPMMEKQGIVTLEPARDVDPDEIVFYCGGSVEAFGPKSDGLGGSEKMVCKMAPALAAKGFRVSVYCECPADQRGMDEKTGVFWWHWGGMRPDDRGTVIFWRSPEMLEMPIGCQKRILWCHDVQEPRRWNHVRVALADQVWVLSEYHATTLGKWREALGDKVKITRNGLDLSAYKPREARQATEVIEREPRKIIFTSSPDRGIGTAISIFQCAKRCFPDRMGGAELHIYYGFTKLFMEHNVRGEYRHIPDLKRDANGWEYMQKIHHAVDHDDDIHWHGRVGWEEMAQAQLSAGVWLYPTRFPEISCMAAAEAQAAGCKVVASDYAALAETINWTLPATYKIDPDKIEEAAATLSDACRANDYVNREELSKWALSKFGFGDLADEWETLIKN